MVHPEYLFYALILPIGVLSMPFNRVAVVAVVAWAFGQWAWNFGVRDYRADLIADAVGLVFALALSFAEFRPSNLLAAVMFAPLVALELAYIRHLMPRNEIYWLDYACAVVQFVALPGGNDWRRAKATWQCYRRSSTIDWFFRTLARRHAL